VQITSGIPDSPVVVPGTELLGVACPSATTCEALGDNFSGDGVVVPITSGIPGGAVVVPGTELLGVACPSATTCEAWASTPLRVATVRAWSCSPAPRLPRRCR